MDMDKVTIGKAKKYWKMVVAMVLFSSAVGTGIVHLKSNYQQIEKNKDSVENLEAGLEKVIRALEEHDTRHDKDAVEIEAVRRHEKLFDKRIEYLEKWLERLDNSK